MSMEHTIDSHLQAVNALCRTCGGICLTRKEMRAWHKPFKCSKYRDDILLIYGADTTLDMEGTHSQFMCRKCYSGMWSSKSKMNASGIRAARTKLEKSDHIWISYKASSWCSVCEQYNARKLGVACPSKFPQPPSTTPAAAPDTTPDAISDTVTPILSPVISDTYHTPQTQYAHIVSDQTIDCPPNNTTSVSIDSTSLFQTPNQSSSQSTYTLSQPQATDPFIPSPPDNTTYVSIDSTSLFQTPNQSSSQSTYTLSQSQATDPFIPSPPDNTTSVSIDSTSLFQTPNQSSSQSTYTLSQPQTTDPFISPSPVATSTPAKIKVKPQTSDSTTSPMIKHYTTISDVLDRPHTAPLSNHEEKLTTRLIKRKLYVAKDNIVSCKTGGQRLILHKIVKHRCSSSEASKTTKRRRKHILSSVRHSIAGPSRIALDTQLASELGSLPIDRRQDIYTKSATKHKVKITKQHILAMKEALGLSWRQARLCSRYLREAGVTVDNENAVRDLSKQLVSDYASIKHKYFSKDLVDVCMPFGMIGQLVSFVDNLLDGYRINGALTWHDNTIPEDEVWLKIGGDHGKHSLKLTLQVANLQHPNSQTNTIVIAMAAIHDSHDNLQRFTHELKPDISQLMHHTWENKSIKVFLNGDYEFLCKIYGISGAQGTFPCIFCLMPRAHMNSANNQHKFKLRTLASLHTDYNSFMSKHNGDKKQAAQHNNCIHAPLLDIPINHVSTPYLHILLGIVLKHHKLLEEAAHSLDKRIALQPDTHLTDFGKLVKTYGSSWKEFQDLTTKIEDLECCIVFTTTDNDKTEYTNRLHNAKETLSQLTHQPLTPRDGPITAQLDKILAQHRITPQAYHSRSFIGNHCHKYLQEKVYTQLTQTIIQHAKMCTDDPFIIDDAYSTQLIFDTLNKAFSHVHTNISHTKPIMEDTILVIENAIKQYMDTYRKHFANKTIPKQHLLEFHCIPHIQTYRFGLGLLGEQGTESCHQTISKIEARAQGIVNDMDKMKFIFNSMLLHTSPRLQKPS